MLVIIFAFGQLVFMDHLLKKTHKTRILSTKFENFIDSYYNKQFNRNRINLWIELFLFKFLYVSILFFNILNGYSVTS